MHVLGYSFQATLRLRYTLGFSWRNLGPRVFSDEAADEDREDPGTEVALGVHNSNIIRKAENPNLCSVLR